MLKITGAVLAAGLVCATQAVAADAPAEIKIGTLYASSGRFASISMPVHSALKLWAEQKNACLLYTSPSPRDGLLYRMPSSA